MNFIMIMWCIELPIILGMIALYVYAHLHRDSEKRHRDERRSYEDQF